MSHFAVAVFLEFQNKADIVIGIPGCHVEVKMKNGLAGDAAIVGQKVVSLKPKPLYECLANDARSLKNGLIRIRGKFQKIPAVLLGNHKGMTIVDGIDVKNGNNLIVLEKDLCRDLFVDYTTENTIVHQSSVPFQRDTGKFIQNSSESQKPHFVVRCPLLLQSRFGIF